MMDPMQALTVAIQAGYRPNATDSMNFLYELQAAFANWPESDWMNINPESLADEICKAQKCMDTPAHGLFELPKFPSIRNEA